MVTGSDETTGTDVPEEFHDLFERPAFASMTTVLPDGTLHGTVVWVGYDGTDLLVNSAEGRRKVKNVRGDPRVCLVVIDPDSAYRYLWVAGEVTEVTTEGAAAQIDGLAQRYLGVEEYPYHDRDSQRVVLRVRPEVCHGYASRVMREFESA